MIQLRKLAGILTSVAVLSAGAVVLETRAADQRATGAAPSSAVPPARAATPSNAVPPAMPAPVPSNAVLPATPAPVPSNAVLPATPAPVPSNAAPPKPPVLGAPQVPEESATIRDDPTIAPDPKQSADNNVSFPNDI